MPLEPIRLPLLLTGVWLSVFCAGSVLAQDVEPRRWTPFPVGTNVVGVAYAYGGGDIAFDPVTRIDDADFQQQSVISSYVHSFGLFGKTARVDVNVPYHSGRWEGRLDGTPTSVRRRGFGDPRVRLSVDLVGPPAMDPQRFRDYMARHPVQTIAGFGVAVRVPLGEYKDDKLINLGQNRYRIRPQLGVLHMRGPWSYELTTSVFFFTNNDDFFGGVRRKQDPIYAAQAHVVRTLATGAWVSAGAAYGWGGENEFDGDASSDEKSDLLFGVALGLPVGRSQAVSLRYIGRRTRRDTGSDTDRLALGWTIRF